MPSITTTPHETPAPDPRVHLTGIGPAVGTILNKLDQLSKDIRDALLNSEQEPDFDQAWTVVNAGGDIVTVSLPNTIRHAEIEMLCSGGVGVALFDGPMTVSQANQQLIGYATGQNNVAGIAPCIMCLVGNKMKVRARLSGTGVLSVFGSTGGNSTYTILRVRNLDRSQMR